MEFDNIPGIWELLLIEPVRLDLSPQRGISEVFAGLDHVGILACLVGIYIYIEISEAVL